MSILDMVSEPDWSKRTIKMKTYFFVLYALYYLILMVLSLSLFFLVDMEYNMSQIVYFTAPLEEIFTEE